MIEAHSASQPGFLGGSVWLVGAGPGDPGLITVRGLRALQRADVVVTDRLVDGALLEEARVGTLIIDASKAPGNHVLTQDQINAALVKHARLGRRVVRLKGGDPYIFGRGWEELAACRAAGIACEVVPGITSAIAAPAAAGIPVTARGVSRTLGIATPQSPAGEDHESLDYAALASMETVVLLMSRAALGQAAQRLIAAGKDPRTPAAIVQDATLPSQRAVFGTLATISSRADEAGIRNPAVVVIGAVVALADRADGPKRGLEGRRIVVTRPTTASGGLISDLRSRGAEVINAPLIRIGYLPVLRGEWITRCYDWVVFTSLHAVRGFRLALQQRGLDARFFAGARVAAVGPKTAEELSALGISPDLVPEVHRASALVDALATRVGSHGVLFPCGTLARDELRSGLRRRGVRVDELVVYETVPISPPPDAMLEIQRGVDAVLLHSPSGAGAALASGMLNYTTVIGCIGPTTAKAVQDAGFATQVVPEQHTDEALVDELQSHLHNCLPRRSRQGAEA